MTEIRNNELLKKARELFKTHPHVAVFYSDGDYAYCNNLNKVKLCLRYSIATPVVDIRYQEWIEKKGR